MEDVNKFRTSHKDRNHTPRQEGKITQVKVAPDDITVWGNLKRGVAQTKTIKKRSQEDRRVRQRRQTAREVVRHIKMDQAPTEVEMERVIEREEVWKSSHD